MSEDLRKGHNSSLVRMDSSCDVGILEYLGRIMTLKLQLKKYTSLTNEVHGKLVRKKGCLSKNNVGII